MPSPPLVNSSNKEFFTAKIKDLSNDKILELLRLNTEANTDVILLAIAEAKRNVWGRRLFWGSAVLLIIILLALLTN
jgi:hypothetical protein